MFAWVFDGKNIVNGMQTKENRFASLHTVAHALISLYYLRLRLAEDR